MATVFDWTLVAMANAAIMAVVAIFDSHLLSKRFPSLWSFILPAGTIHLCLGLIFLTIYPLAQGIDPVILIIAFGSGIIRAGENYLIVKVANTWLNRLNADDQLPVDARRTHTNLTRGPTGSTAWRDATPLPSGLLGPVRLIAQERHVIAAK